MKYNVYEKIVVPKNALIFGVLSIICNIGNFSYSTSNSYLFLRKINTIVSITLKFEHLVVIITSLLTFYTISTVPPRLLFHNVEENGEGPS